MSFFPRTEHDAIRAAVLDKHIVDSGRGANLRAQMAPRIGDHPTDRSTICMRFCPRPEHDAIRAAVLDKHMVDSGRGANLRAKMARRIGDHPTYRSHSAAGKAPGTKGAVQLAHIVMQ